MKKHLLIITNILFVTMCISCHAKKLVNGVKSMNLSGKWHFQLDPNNKGIQDRWFENSLKDSIKLPGTTDEGGFGAMGPETPDRVGVLTRRHEYLGVAWYSREINIPKSWKDYDISLHLERVMWQSQLWIDGKKVGVPQDSLCVPHIYQLGNLASGKHQLTMKIDNRMIHPIGNKNHGYGEQTQSRWNGVIGEIKLNARPKSQIKSLRVFTNNLPNNQMQFGIKNSGTMAGLKVRCSIIDPKGGKVIGISQKEVAKSIQNINVTCTINPIQWSEFTPKTYLAKVELFRDDKLYDTLTSTCGFRKISNKGNKLLINGKPVFMRGNLDCVHFPKTGYPSPYKKDWIRIFKTYQEYNLNHVRFHSWCPPKAAFEAADELGIYMQAEGPIWIDHWMTHKNSRPEMDCEGYPQGIGKNDRTLDQFAKAEFRRILDEYGNHPSFMFFCFGNELGTSNFAETAKWVKELKEYDPRRLYAASAARTITKYCDFNATHAIPGIGWCRQHYEFGTNWDYEKLYGRVHVPIISHEVGQWPVYPKWSLIDKFDGVLRNTRLERMREQAKKNGVFSDQEAFTKSSGALNQTLYKDEVESFLRTPSCRGFQLLSLQDFQGQGEAYIGWLDCFWDSKGTTDPKVFRGYCAPVVALAKLSSYVFTNGDNFSCDLLVRNDSDKDLNNKQLIVKLVTTDGKIISQTFYKVNAKCGEVITVGKFSATLTANSARRLNLVLSLEGKKEDNSYPLWVYPKSLPEINDSKIVITGEFNAQTIKLLSEGRSVLLKANRLGDEKASKNAAWMPLYWSVPFFPGQSKDTLGLVVKNNHPAFANFPTSYFNNWQWYRICRGARGFDLTHKIPESYKPIAQPVTDFHINKKLGSIFELKVGKGKLLVCGYNLDSNLPETKQLKYSLLKYMTSKKFKPKQNIPLEDLKNLFKFIAKAPVATPKGFEKAIFYVKAGGKKNSNGNQPWSLKLDDVKVAKGVTYKVKANGVWKDASGTAWHGKNITIDFKVPDGILADIYIHVHDWNGQGRSGTIEFEGRKFKLDRHAGKGKWLKLMVMREDANDGKLKLKADCIQGGNLMITAIAIIPKD